MMKWIIATAWSESLGAPTELEYWGEKVGSILGTWANLALLVELPCSADGSTCFCYLLDCEKEYYKNNIIHIYLGDKVIYMWIICVYILMHVYIELCVCVYKLYIGLAKKFVQVFCKMLCKNPNEFFGQLNTWYFLPKIFHVGITFKYIYWNLFRKPSVQAKEPQS